MKDIFGKALQDYHAGNYTEDIITATNISDDDELPLPYLFRSYAEMPELEQKALQLCKGRVLDVGCGAGSHALWLQDQGLEVTAVDVSKGAVEVCEARGVKNTRRSNILDISEEKFDTILLLMNGTGIFGTLDQVPHFLQHLKHILNTNGQVLIDSSDLQYMYDRNPDGSIWVPANRYYGELEFTMSYKGETTEVFPWLYVDQQRFQSLATEQGFTFDVMAEGENFDYLAKLTPTVP